MCEKKIGVILVYQSSNNNQEKNYTGILSDSDIISSLCKYDDITKIKIYELMTKNLIVASENDSLQYALNVMIKNKISHLPIVSNKKLIAVISIKDLISELYNEDEIKIRYYGEYLSGTYQSDIF